MKKSDKSVKQSKKMYTKVSNSVAIMNILFKKMKKNDENVITKIHK